MRRTLFAAVLFLSVAACGDDNSGPDTPGDGGIIDLRITTSNGSPASAPTFPTTRPNVDSELTLTLTNMSKASTGTITLSLDNQDDFTLRGTSTCANAEIVDGASCTIVVALSGMTATTYMTNLTVAMEKYISLPVPLSGEITLPDVSVTPTTYNFGTVPIGTMHTFTVRNNDTVAFNGAINANGPFAVSGDCVLPLAPATSCSVIIAVDGDGAFAGSLAIGLDATNMITVPITGTGT